ncbi:nitroreductase family protein [Nocardioides ultimimeridianus]
MVIAAPLPPRVLDRVLSAVHCGSFVLVRSPLALRVFAEHVELEQERLGAVESEEVAAVTACGLGVVVGHDPARGGLSAVLCAIQRLMLAAAAEELGVRWVSSWREEFLRSLVGMPDHVRPVAWLCLGTLEGMAEAPVVEPAGWRHRSPLVSVLYEEYDEAAGGLSA